MSLTMRTIALATLLACSGTRGIAAADLPVPRSMVSDATALASSTTDALSETSPETTITQLYLKSVTVNDITAANQQLEDIISKIRLSESAVNKLYEAAMQSCDRVSDLESSNIEAIVTNARRLDKSLTGIDLRLKRSIETMRQSLETSGSGILLFKTGAELRRFESAYGEYSRLRLSIHQLANGLGALSRDLPKAQQLCKPLVIPSLSAEPLTPASRPQPTTARSSPAVKSAQTARGNPLPSKPW